MHYDVSIFLLYQFPIYLIRISVSNLYPISDFDRYKYQFYIFDNIYICIQKLEVDTDMVNVVSNSYLICLHL